MSPRTAAITGASAGVGRATARLLGGRGDRIGLIARGEEGLKATVADVEDRGGMAIAAPADVADPEAVEAAAALIESELGPIDVWINNAMTTVFSPISEMEPDEFARVTEVTYLGTVHGTLAALRRMRPRNSGRIVQVGSALAYRPIPLQSAYCAAKHAVLGFTDALRTELMHDGLDISVTTVHLPAINTPQFTWSRVHVDREPQPVPPIFDPTVAARAIAWATDHDRREMWVGYPSVLTILGDKLVPGLLDRYLARNGVASQMTDVPVAPDRRDNLYQPVPGDHGARGPFGDRSRATSPMLAASMHRRWIATGLAAVAAGGAAGFRLARSR